MDSATREIRLVDSTGVQHAGRVDYCDRSRREDGFLRRECSIILRWDGGEVSASDWNNFAALRLVREQLATIGLIPVCYGASRNVIITGMAADMGAGLKVYRVELGRHSTRQGLVSIFDSGPDVDPVTVEEQDEFRDRYRASLRPPNAASAGGNA